jgi:predicted histone-like DNA-binding protein
MAIFYNKVERPRPGDLKTKKWYAGLKMVGQAGEKEVARQIADETTLNPKEAEMALDQFRKILIRMLLDSKSVQLGDWGSFRLTCNSTGHDTREGVGAHSVKKFNIRFTPGKELRNALAGATLEATESIVSGKGSRK